MDDDRTAAVVGETDEHQTDDGEQQKSDFTAEERRGRSDTDETGEHDARVADAEEEHEELEGGFHWVVFLLAASIASAVPSGDVIFKSMIPRGID